MAGKIEAVAEPIKSQRSTCQTSFKSFQETVAVSLI